MWVHTKGHELDRFVKGSQLHALSFLGSYWAEGPARMPDELAIGYTKYIARRGGAMTWEVPTTYDGRLAEEFRPQLAAIGASL
jgi:hypothetical protein